MVRLQAELNLFLATIALTISLAIWGLIPGLAPIFRAELGLTATQTSLIVAIPVLLGSIGRLPIGLLTDRLGGRLLVGLLLAFAIVPCLALAANHSYLSLLFWGCWIGLAGTSFAVGIPFLSPWFPPQRQGTALGIYGAGNIGQSIAVFVGPLLASAIGIAATFSLFGLASLAWGWVFARLARNAPWRPRSTTWCENLHVLRRERLAWVLSLFYFLTFGGFVALGISLPTLLGDLFYFSPVDAVARTAGFVGLATLCRPVGGWIADRVGGQPVLRLVFLGLVASAWLLVFASITQEASSADRVSGQDDAPWLSGVPPIYPFTLGALGCAMLLGLGNGAVFKLVAQCFPRATGTVTGLVGAAGGLGGFFPAITLGAFRDISGSYAPGFVLLSAFALWCALFLSHVPVLGMTAPAPPSTCTNDRLPGHQ